MFKKVDFARCGRGARMSAESLQILKLAVAWLTVVMALWRPGSFLWARPADALNAVTDKISYNVGSEVHVKVFLSAGQTFFQTPLDIVAFVRYEGESKPLMQRGLEVANHFVPRGSGNLTDYRVLWKIPAEARTGRYEIDLVASKSDSHAVVINAPSAASFAVYRKLVEIDRVQLDKTFYVPGDPVGTTVSIRNLADHPLNGLRVEFSDRYWPWIAQSPERAGVDVTTLTESLALGAGAEQSLSSARAAAARTVKRPAIQQYAVVVWDHDRKNIYDIAFSPLAFIHPPGVDSPRPYGLQYVYPNLDAVNTARYRQFYPAELDFSAIQFDRDHTMFAPGSEATIRFSVRNPTGQPWRAVTVRARLLAPDGRELTSRDILKGTDLSPHGSPLDEKTTITLPTEASGLYRATVEVGDSAGQILAANDLELGMNPLPKSVLVFCAHEDDEMGHAGLIRAAVENHIPLHVVYFTSGDAGSCDRYYQHSCRPAEALNFGALRMDEVRAALGHLGVRREEILFLGLPDGGSGQIWYDHVTSADPYLSVLLASDHAPYEGLVHPNLPYARDSVVEAAEELIVKFEPEVIYTAHPPSEGHIDHIINNYFVVKALQELLKEDRVSRRLTVLVDQVYDPRERPPTPYRYEDYVLNVSGEVKALAQEAGWFYQSQAGNRAQGNIRDFSELERTERYRKVLDWSDHAGWNETH